MLVGESCDIFSNCNIMSENPGT